MVDAIIDHCKNDVGFASLKNVQTFEKTNSMESFFSVYPNPSYGVFQLAVDNMPSSKGVPIAIGIEIYNAAGEKVYTAPNIKQQMQIDLSALPKGIYFVRLLTDDGTKIYNQKIVAQ